MADYIDLARAIVIFIYEAVVGYFMWIVESFTKKPKSMVGKVVVITGGASGIGKELGQVFSNLGAKIALLDITADSNSKVANEINENAGLAIAFTVDVTKPEQLREVALKVERHPNLGVPDVVVCNAGVSCPKSLLEQSDDDVRRTMDVNLLGYFWTVRAFLPQMMERNRGHIAAICSMAGYFGTSNCSAYSASKFGVRGLMESLECELHDAGKHNVKVTTVYPYFTNTPMLTSMAINSRVFQVMSVEQTAATIVNAILYEKSEAYSSIVASLACNFIKATTPQPLMKAWKRFAE